MSTRDPRDSRLHLPHLDKLPQQATHQPTLMQPTYPRCSGSSSSRSRSSKGSSSSKGGRRCRRCSSRYLCLCAYVSRKVFPCMHASIYIYIYPCWSMRAFASGRRGVSCLLYVVSSPLGCCLPWVQRSAPGGWGARTAPRCCLQRPIDGDLVQAAAHAGPLQQWLQWGEAAARWSP